MKRALVAALALLALVPEGAAQNAITQEGTVLQNSPMMFRGNNRARQGAPVGGAPSGQIVTTGDAVVGGRCDYSAPIDASSGYAKLCIDAKNGSIELGGTAPPTTLKFIINGTVYEVPLSAAIVGSDAVVGNNVALKALAGSDGKRITRLGFGSIGDGGLAAYNWSGSNCPAPDNGAQVQPTGITGCWIADFSGVMAQIQVWGGLADDGIDDAPAIIAATKVLNGRDLYFPRGGYHLCTEMVSTVPISIKGDGSGAGAGSVNPVTKFEICSATNNGFRVTSQYPSKFEGFWLTSTVPQAPGYAGIVLQHAAGYQSRTHFEDVSLGSASYDGAMTLYDAIKMLEPNYPNFERIHCQGWQNSCINLTTTAAHEGSGGFIHHSYFFGNPLNTLQGPAIYSEVGYTFIHHNEILGGSNGVHFCIKNRPAGEIDIHHNTIENHRLYGVLVQSCDGNAAAMLHITDNEFSNYDYASAMVAHVHTGEYTVPGPSQKWLKNVTITGNIFHSNLPASAKYIWFSAGSNAVISNNVIDHLGGSDAPGIVVSGAGTNASLDKPIIVRDNMISGTISWYVGNVTVQPTFIDMTGTLAIGNLPPYPAAGSMILINNGVPGSRPCSSPGSGALSVFSGGVWNCL